MFDLKEEDSLQLHSVTSAGSTGHSYLVYRPLANKAACVIWEGEPGDRRTLTGTGTWYQRYVVTVFYERADRDPRGR